LVLRDEGFNRGRATSSSCASCSRRTSIKTSRILTSRSLWGIEDREERRQAWGTDVDGDIIVRHWGMKVEWDKGWLPL